MLWLDFDPTTACVVLLILVLSGLWAYVTIARGNTRQPRFDILYEQQTNKKAPKSKGKRKQVVEVSSKEVQKKVNPASHDTSESSTDTKNAGHNGNNDSGIKQVVAEEIKQASPRVSKDKKQGNQGQQKKTKEHTQQKKTKIPEQKKAKVDVEQGTSRTEELPKEEEWQTQLSRPQLRARKQKQRDKQGVGASSSGGRLPEGAANIDKPGDERLDAGRPISGSSSGSKKGSKKKKKNAAQSSSSPPASTDERSTSASSEDRGSPADRGTSEDKETSASPQATSETAESSGIGIALKPDTGEGRHGSLSPELHVVSQLQGTDFEMALVEAARSSMSSTEEDRNLTTAPTTEKQNKSQSAEIKSESKGEVIAESVTDNVWNEGVASSENQEEWVVI